MNIDKIMTNEIWKNIPGVPETYKVSNKGRFMNAKTGRILKQYTNGSTNILTAGYMSGYQEQTSATIASLVLRAFVGPAPKFEHPHYKDGNTTNVSLSNLRWSRLDAPLNRIGSNNVNSKFTEEQISRVKDLLYKKIKYKEIAKKTGVSHGVIALVAVNAAWKHVN